MEVFYNERDFYYPTNEEWGEINNSKPKFELFSFPVIDEITELLANKVNPKIVLKRSHLYWWNSCLKHKIESLIHAYSFALVNFNRGIPDNLETYKYYNYINRGQFDFYSETYFYFFIAVEDTIAQILNVYYETGLKEYQIELKEKYISKIPNTAIKNKIKQFLIDTEDVTNYRNRFTHRFLVTHPDYRPSIKEENGLTQFGAGTGEFTKSSDLANHIKISIEQLASFIADLSILII